VLTVVLIPPTPTVAQRACCGFIWYRAAQHSVNVAGTGTSSLSVCSANALSSWADQWHSNSDSCGKRGTWCVCALQPVVAWISNFGWYARSTRICWGILQLSSGCSGAFPEIASQHAFTVSAYAVKIMAFQEYHICDYRFSFALLQAKKLR